MPTIRIYPNAVVAGYDYSTSELTKLFSGTSQAIHQGAVVVQGAIGGEFRFPIAAYLPADATVESINACWQLSASAAGSRRFYYVRALSPGINKYWLVNLMADGSLQSFTISKAELDAALLTTAALRNSSASWQFVFQSFNGSSLTTYWSQAYLDITYTTPGGAVNPLFFGENF